MQLQEHKAHKPRAPTWEKREKHRKFERGIKLENVFIKKETFEMCHFQGIKLNMWLFVFLHLIYYRP